ncbi:succinylglutamate desuccinylase/aspartoacylase family protein [Cyanobacterium stanieri LEGE 03274]|uniref:Succinylglutamate desuccinylase/aspartoacylase family protein n=1 Tax=Cyanobacterium stanieri LEGE 03274 TaxID=1828756 RepID=A0ABR9V2S6_9CHRO|nr:succinylglutamate desuccinylase/aspartoacylase family protein [Cyanobacterium stanieri LEGE 03274]
MSKIIIAGEEVAPSQVKQIQIPVAKLPTQTMMSLPVTVINGKEDGARLWLSAAIHGDEINGVEIIRRVVSLINPERLKGCIIAVPIVNVFGFIEQSRYLPDRRDLNRSFPGSESGSLASRLAELFMREVVANCTHGIDLHTAAIHRVNLPQIRANLEDEETRLCAIAFNTPVMIHATTRDGSLRQAASKKGIPILLYEGGEALRFDGKAIDTGVRGILRVMNYLKMYNIYNHDLEKKSIMVHKSKWIRASSSGIYLLETELGAEVRKKQVLGKITDPFGNKSVAIKAPFSGIVIGHVQNPLVNQGDAIIHLASAEET